MGNRYEKLTVVKIGTDTLVRGGEFDSAYGKDVAGQIAEVREEGMGIILTSSGAMALGEKRLGSDASQVEKARVGQALLREGWSKSFADAGLESQEVLFVPGNVDAGALRVDQALHLGRIPNINGDDSSRLKAHFPETEDIGNNDVLGKILAIRFQAAYLMLTTTNGVLDNRGEMIANVADPSEVTVFEYKSVHGTGGMATKLRAGYDVALTGQRVEIANGRRAGVIRDFAAGTQVGTRIALR